MSSTPPSDSTANAWKNWHKTTNVGGPVQRVFQPNNGTATEQEPIQHDAFLPGLEALLHIVEQALQDDDQPRLRAFGSKWSLNNAAYTKDYMVQTWGLNYAKIGLEATQVTPAYTHKADKLCFVQAGVMIHYLSEVLFQHQLALPTTGASDGQRLIGAISTGTHGSAINYGAMPDYVRGIHLVLPDGDDRAKHIFLQRERDQVVNGTFASFLGDTTIVDDDALFEAAVVGFGCFGLIHGLLIETEALFQLQYQTVRFNPHLSTYQAPLRRVLGAPTRGNIRALGPASLFNWLHGVDGYPYFVSITRNPYDGLFPRTLFLQVMEKLPFHSEHNALAMNTDAHIYTHEKHEAVHEGIRTQLHQHKDRDGLELTKRELSDGIQIGLRNFHHHESLDPMAAAHTPPTTNFVNYIFHTSSATSPSTHAPTPATSTEIAVPLDRANDAVDCILATLQTYHLAAPLGIRYLPPSNATLATNQYNDTTVTIELPGPEKGKGIFSLIPDAGIAHQEIFQALNSRGIPHRYHWGQQYPMNGDWVNRSYPKGQAEQWKAARQRLLPTAKAQRLFSNPMTDAIGLT